MLFTRLRADDRAFWFLGPATYRSHVGEKPMAITWELHTPLPGDLYQAFAAAVTQTIADHPAIEVIREEVPAIPASRPVIVASGPLTSDRLAADLATRFAAFLEPRAASPESRTAEPRTAEPRPSAPHTAVPSPLPLGNIPFAPSRANSLVSSVGGHRAIRLESYVVRIRPKSQPSPLKLVFVAGVAASRPGKSFHARKIHGTPRRNGLPTECNAAKDRPHR